MPRTLLLVESEEAVVDTVRPELQRRGFTVEHTSEGKGCIELIRRIEPEAVILAVELPAGQNGYLVCREIKKDDALKQIPVVIVGSPEKFADHKKLRTHADEYVAKPLAMDDFLERLGGLIGGMPEPVEDAAETDALVEDDSLNFSEMLEEAEEPAEEISVDADLEAEDPDLALLDSALVEAPDEEPVVLDEDLPSAEEDAALASFGDGGEAQSEDDVLSALEESPPARSARAATLDDMPAQDVYSTRTDPVPEEEPPPPVPLRTGASADAAELRSLRAKSKELQDELERVETRASEAEERITSLEAQLAERAAELESKQGTKGDKDYFALREAANKKDKEILRLKNELNEKEQSELELREHEVELEQKLSEHAAEMSRKDAQLKTLTGRADALISEKKRAETQTHTARDEARAAGERLQTVEDELREVTERAERLDRELEEAKSQMQEQASFAEEGEGLRARVAELEGQLSKHEERVNKLYQRIKGDEKLRDRVKKALNIATQLLDEQAAATAEEDEGSGDAPRAA